MYRTDLHVLIDANLSSCFLLCISFISLLIPTFIVLLSSRYHRQMFTNWIIVFWGNWASIAICAYVLAYQGQVTFCISCFITSWRAPFYTHGFILWSTSSHQHHDTHTLSTINIILLSHLLSTSSLTSHSHLLSTQLYATDPWLTWLQSLAMHKVEYGWSVVVCRAIGANWMVCCAVCMSIASQVMRCMIACMI